MYLYYNISKYLPIGIAIYWYFGNVSKKKNEYNINSNQASCNKCIGYIYYNVYNYILKMTCLIINVFIIYMV